MAKNRSQQLLLEGIEDIIDGLTEKYQMNGLDDQQIDVILGEVYVFTKTQIIEALKENLEDPAFLDKEFEDDIELKVHSK